MDVRAFFTSYYQPIFSFLAPFGYDAVGLPRSGITPLQVFEESKKELKNLGTLKDLFDDTFLAKKQPIIRKSIAIADISGVKSGDIKFNEGLSILRGIISSFGGSTLGLDTTYQNINSISFKYEGVLAESVDRLNLEKYLSDSYDYILCSQRTRNLIDRGKICVITSIIKSRKFTVIPKAAKGFNVDVSLPQLQGIVGANVGVKTGGENSSDITFEGKKFLVFGFQAVNLCFGAERRGGGFRGTERGHYVLRRPAGKGKPF